MISILQKEINSFLNSMIAYLVVGVFLVAIGLFLWVFPETSVLEYGYADMQTLFNLAPWLFLFLIPAVTMRSFSEEKKGGTMELLLTKPITDTQLILGKYLACLFLVVVGGGSKASTTKNRQGRYFPRLSWGSGWRAARIVAGAAARHKVDGVDAAAIEALAAP